jgi:predicted CXXCH cytochrome family protein
MVSSKTILSYLMVTIALGIGAWLVEPVYADGPPPDYACRGCHGDNQNELTLPSGETLPLLVPLSALDQSPHNATAETSILCTDCHTPRVRYQYPHQPNPAQTRREFASFVSENCQACHYPHRPLHASGQPNSALPTCADCHGSHQIDRIDNILDTMPAACVACHTNQTPEWATAYIAPRSGLGQAAEGYTGSYRCAGCHEDIYLSWRETLHARMIQDPAADPSVIVGDFNQPDPDLTFDLSDVVYTIGSRWKQQYLTQDEKGDFYILPAQWNVETGEWVAYKPNTWQENEWQQSCGSCHVTGLNTQTWGFVEFGLACESCHGPGADHAADPEKVKPFAEVDDQVCGACHSRGTSSDGLAFPATYRPGNTLTDHFTFTISKSDIWPDGSAKKNYQQYMDWQLGSPMALDANTNCVTCHAVHDSGIGQAQLRAPLNELCWQCHNDKRAIIEHIPYHDRAISKHEFVCSDCHMPKMATSAGPYDIHNHSFLQPNPQASLDHGGIEAMPNACNTCHTDLGEDPQWAADTIAYVNTILTPVPGAAFGPGPTPTSPPPPTPIPSAGQKAEVEHFQVGTGRGLRNTVFVIFGLIVIGVIYLGYRSVRSRRLNNV